MDLRIFTEPQEGASYDDLLAVARATEDCGFDGFFRSDHFTAFFGGDGQPGPTDAWVTLAGLARETSRIRLGTLVSAATFRLPGVLAISVAQVDVMSGGRVELGLGTGWHEGEHTAYGIPFPSLGERFDRFEEQLQVVTGLWEADGPFSFTGEHYVLRDAPALPKPAQRPRPPVIVGGRGRTRTPRIAATYADEFNLPFETLEATAEQFGRVRDACTRTGRALVLSAAQTVCVGRDDAEVRHRSDAIGAAPDRLRQNGLTGTPAEVVDRIGRFAEAGASRLYLQVLDLADLDHLELVAAEFAPQL
jgi:F420-dependent oxidoreductase-like protein